jgi:TRAP transporter TAXI family solute receptor
LGTASAGGSWYPIGAGLASLFNSNIPSVKFTAQSTTGAPENVDMVKNGEMGFGMAYPIVTTPAWHGIMNFEGNQYQDLRTVCTLFENVQSPVVLKKHVKTGNIVDLEGLRFNVAPAGSGTAIEWELIQEVLGINFIPEYLSFQQGADGLKNGTLDGATLNAALPHQTIVQLIQEGVPIQILSITEEQCEKVNEVLDYCHYREIPANTYQGQTEAIPMTAQATFLFTSKQMDEELVYNVTKVLLENVDELKKIHSSMSGFSAETALLGLKQPLHVGAIKYYREIGVEIPPELIPPEAN